MNFKDNESGNILIIILVAIVLLGSLTALLSRTGGSSNETGEYERSSLLVGRFIRFGQSLGEGIKQLLLRGCSENQISFEDPLLSTQGPFSTHANPNAPSDFSCHIFRPEGAGLTYWITDDAGIYQPPPVVEFYINGGGWWHPNSPNAPITDWAMILENLTLESCLAFNNALGVPNPGGNPPDATAESPGGSSFTGTFPTSHAANREVRSAGGELETHFSACFENTFNQYTYYQTLHFR